MKKQTQEQFAKVIIKTTDLNMRAKVDDWMKKIDDCMVTTQTQSISKLTNTLTTATSVKNNQKEAYGLGRQILEEVLLDPSFKSHNYFALGNK